MRLFALTVVVGLLATPIAADERDIGAHLDIELNATQQAEAGCQLTFVAVNGHAAEVEQAVFETVLFKSDGAVDRLTLFDFGALPPGLPRVRQFVVQGLQCAELGRLLINGVHACRAPDVPGDACGEGLTVSSRIAVGLIG
ncbi:hypothetical protein [Aestuariivita sp.]|jgi:hypothetical protein|uniref:hypothetical protein n=1 Tax=Aestuariivita sp. TaxID=1872407 RepID=UPI002172DC9B|nr:hypothetical protein [Aestuariivita sp.]MCE8006153.1 hypothetical protein [Aestuariivita sp.]